MYLLYLRFGWKKASAIAFLVLGLLLMPTVATAFAQNVPGPGTPVSVPDGPATQFVPLYLVVLGAVTPLAGYLINHFGPQTSEQVKGIVQGVLAAGVAVLYQAVTPGNLGLNTQTLLAVLTTMVSSLVGHYGWKTAGINTTLGGGFNHTKAGPDIPSDARDIPENYPLPKV
jgi:hypothetical protein